MCAGVCGKVPLLAQHRHISQPRRLGPHSRETSTPLKVLAAHMPPPEQQVRQLMHVCIAQNTKAMRCPFKAKYKCNTPALSHVTRLLLGDVGKNHANASVHFRVLWQKFSTSKLRGSTDDNS